MTSTASLFSITQQSSLQSAVYIKSSNALSDANFLTAVNPSSANGGLGATFLLGTGYGPIYFRPTVPHVAVDSNSADGVLAYDGTVLAINPVGGQTFSGYSINLSTTDANTPIFTAGPLVVTSNAVVAQNFSVLAFSSQSLFIGTVTPSVTYLSVTSTNAVIGVPLAFSAGIGVTSDMLVTGSNSATKFSVVAASTQPLFLVDTATNVVGLGTSSQAVNIDGFGSFILAGGPSSTKLSISSGGSSPDLLLDSQDGTLAIADYLVSMAGTLALGGPGEALKFVVYDHLAAAQFTIDSTLGVTAVVGTDQSNKFGVFDAASNLTFSVSTNVGAVSQRIVSVTNLQPVTDNTYSCGAPGSRFTVVYAVSGTINTSDARQKSVLSRVADYRCLEAVESSPVFSFLRKDAAGVAGGLPELGVMAQDLEQSLAGLGAEHSVVRDCDGILGVSNVQQLAVLWSAVRALSAEVAELKAALGR